MKKQKLTNAQFRFRNIVEMYFNIEIDGKVEKYNDKMYTFTSKKTGQKYLFDKCNSFENDSQQFLIALKKIGDYIYLKSFREFKDAIHLNYIIKIPSSFDAVVSCYYYNYKLKKWMAVETEKETIFYRPL